MKYRLLLLTWITAGLGATIVARAHQLPDQAGGIPIETLGALIWGAGVAVQGVWSLKSYLAGRRDTTVAG